MEEQNVLTKIKGNVKITLKSIFCFDVSTIMLTFATSNKKQTIKVTKKIMKRTTELKDNVNYTRVETYDLSQEQHDIAVEMVTKNQPKNGNYTLEESDTEMVNVWIADAHSEGEEEYAEFLRNALAQSCDMYTLTDHLGEFSQPIGDVAVF